MKTTQISVFLDNKPGRLAEVTGLLAGAKINIRALSLAETADFGVLRLIVNDNAACLAVLKENRFVAQETEVIAIEVEDRPGGLHRILDVLDKAGINIEYMYAFVEKKKDNAIVVFKIDACREAVEVLSKNGIAVVSQDVIRNL
ncbi:MAG TPA: amino acid-binding protein [Planctomycetes bacterium]|nr:amino acid-binding protein [Planctomycetota bacterium]